MGTPTFIEIWSRRLVIGLLGIVAIIPLATDNHFFFPFIFTKAILFRSAIELVVVAYAFLVWANPNYRPRLNLAGWSLIAFTVIAALASWFGYDWHLSFWGDIERSEGLLLWLHLVPFFIITIAVLKNDKEWQRLLDFSLGIALLTALFALGQALGVENLLNTTGERVASTIGNPAFYAAYLLLHLGLASMLLVKKWSQVAWRWYYVILIGLFSYIILETQVRGAVVGLAAGAVIAGLSLLIKNPHLSSRLRRGVYISLTLLVLACGSLYAFRHASWLEQFPTWRRLTTISPNARTAETRLVTWQVAWQAWQQRPVLGYGLEHFMSVFDRRFPPLIYGKEGSQVWFDRAHNVVFDRGVTTGWLGLLAYGLFLLSPLYVLWRRFQKHNSNLNSTNRLLAAVVVGLTIAYLVQDLFVFESITTYISLLFIWAYISSLEEVASPAPLTARVLKITRWFAGGLGLIALLAWWPVMSLVNIQPAKVNAAAAAVSSLNPQTESFFKIVDQFKQVIADDTYGLQEYRLQFIDFVSQQLASVGEVAAEVKPVLTYAEEQVDAQIKQAPYDAKNYLLAMRFYNYTHAALKDQNVQRLEKARSYFPILQALTPTRPHVYQEMGYSYLYEYRFHRELKQSDQAAVAAKAAAKYFQQSIDLNPKVVESYINLIQLYYEQNVLDEARQAIATMQKAGAPWRQLRYVQQLTGLAINAKDYSTAATLLKGYFEVNSADVTMLTQLALAQAYAGDDTAAIATAEQIKQLDSTQTIVADDFIKAVKGGQYRPKK